MVMIQNGLIACPKCKGDKKYTPVGLALHWAEEHPVKLTVQSLPASAECPLGFSKADCMQCWYNRVGKGCCSFRMFKDTVLDANEAINRGEKPLSFDQG